MRCKRKEKHKKETTNGRDETKRKIRKGRNESLNFNLQLVNAKKISPSSPPPSTRSRSRTSIRRSASSPRCGHTKSVPKKSPSSKTRRNWKTETPSSGRSFIHSYRVPDPRLWRAEVEWRNGMADRSADDLICVGIEVGWCWVQEEAGDPTLTCLSHEFPQPHLF